MVYLLFTLKRLHIILFISYYIYILHCIQKRTCPLVASPMISACPTCQTLAFFFVLTSEPVENQGVKAWNFAKQLTASNLLIHWMSQVHRLLIHVAKNKPSRVAEPDKPVNRKKVSDLRQKILASVRHSVSVSEGLRLLRGPGSI